MPTKNPRLTITLTPSLGAQLRTIAELSGNSQSSLIAELLEGSGPVFVRMIDVLQAAKGAREAMRGKVAQDLDNAQGKLEAQLGLAMDTFNEYTGDLLDEAEAVKRRVKKGSAGGLRVRSAALPSTPLSNRGVRSKNKTDKSPTKSRS
jgi:hypothetical protein